LTAAGHGGIAWQNKAGGWSGVRAGLLADDKEQKTYAQISYLGCVDKKEEVARRAGEKHGTHAVKMTGGREVAYANDGTEHVRYRFLQPIQPDALRPFLPPRREHLGAVRVAGTLQPEWLAAKIKELRGGGAAAVPAPKPDAAPAGLEQIQRLFKGNVENYDPNTGGITLTYDFKGSFGRSDLKEDWIVKVANQTYRRHVAVFVGDLDCTCKEFLASGALLENNHGGVAVLDREGRWTEFHAGLVRDEKDPNKILTQIWAPGAGRRQEPAGIKAGEHPAVDKYKIVAERDGARLLYTIDGKGEVARDTHMPADGLRPFLPSRDSIMTARIVGTRQKEWLAEQLPGPR
jgi:hypothetical protein